MDGTSILREQLKCYHGTAEQAVADLTPDHLHHRAPTGTIDSIAHIYAHSVMAEDWLLSKYVRRQPTLYERDGWAAKTGLPAWSDHGPTEDWAPAVRECDFGALRAYAARVYAATDEILASLSASDLDRAVVFGSLGEIPLGAFLANVVAGHSVHHAGEICALKGVLGGKGLSY